MCLAIYKPKGFTIPKEHLMSGYAGNRSGCGFIFHEKGKLHTFKKLCPFTEFYANYLEIEKDHDMAVHFRAATHGPRNNANCHPFVMCGGKFAMIHNGIFHVDLENRALSDTGNYAHLVMEPAIKDGTYRNKRTITNGWKGEREEYSLVAEPRWGWGAVVLMSADGEATIYNEIMGHWDKGIWYSNRGYSYGPREKESELVPYGGMYQSCGLDDDGD